MGPASLFGRQADDTHNNSSDGVCWQCMECDGVWHRWPLVAIDGIQWHLMVFGSIQWYCVTSAGAILAATASCSPTTPVSTFMMMVYCPGQNYTIPRTTTCPKPCHALHQKGRQPLQEMQPSPPGPNAQTRPPLCRDAVPERSSCVSSTCCSAVWSTVNWMASAAGRVRR